MYAKSKTSKYVVFAFLVMCALLVMALEAESRPAPKSQCDQAAEVAGHQEGVPVNVLRAITRVETGRTTGNRFEPWPWTVNWNGEGSWFPNRKAAEGYVKELIRSGHSSFDVGCYQMNFRWHGHKFSSVEQMFDPLTNARHAARFLKEKFRVKQNWKSAAGAYHSKTALFAQRYEAKFELSYAALGPMADNAIPQRGPRNQERAAATFLPQIERSPHGARLGSLVGIRRSASRPSMWWTN